MGAMEGRKYSTGTKGRLKMHSDQCREFIHAHAPSFALAEEFVASIDPKREDAVWQRFQDPADLAPLLEAWLNGEPEPTEAVRQTLQPASVVSKVKRLPPAVELAFKRTEAWIEGGALDEMTKREAARAALEKLRGEL